MKEKLSSVAMGYSIGLISAICMILLGILGSIGIYTGVANMMGQWHMFFNLSLIGTISGAIEAGILGFLAGYSTIWIYNKLA